MTDDQIGAICFIVFIVAVSIPFLIMGKAISGYEGIIPMSDDDKRMANEQAGKELWKVSPPPKTESPEHPLVTATKRAIIWGKIFDAISDEETKQLALAEYKKLGRKGRK